MLVGQTLPVMEGLMGARGTSLSPHPHLYSNRIRTHSTAKAVAVIPSLWSLLL